MVGGREREEAVEVGHAAGNDADRVLQGGSAQGGGLGEGVEIRGEDVRADDGGGECSEECGAEKEAEGKAPASPEKEEKKDGDGELELDEGEGEDEAGEERAAGFEKGEGEAADQQEDDGELAHDKREAEGKEAEIEERWGERPAFNERGQVRAHDADGESEKCEVGEAEEEERELKWREGEQGEGQGGEGWGEEGERDGFRSDKNALEALLGGVVVKEAGLAGAEHGTGGVVAAEVDGAGANGGSEAEADEDFEDEECPEVELEAFWCEVHRGGSARDG